MPRHSLAIPVDDLVFLNLNLDDAEPVDPAVEHRFRVNYLEMLEWKIEIGERRVDRLEFLHDKIYDLRAEIAVIRFDPEGDGITRAERHQLRDLKGELHDTIDRYEGGQDYDVVVDRLIDMKIDFAEKSDEWGISI